MPVDRHTVVRTLIRDRSRLYGYILSIVRDAHLAEDVLQDLSIVVIDKCAEIDDAAALPTWMRKAARFKALQLLERRGQRAMSLDDSMLELIDRDWAAFDATASGDMTDALRHCLGGLTDNNRRLIELRYGQGLKSGQVADRMGRSAHAVYVALCRVHKQLGDCIEAKLAGESGRG